MSSANGPAARAGDPLPAPPSAIGRVVTAMVTPFTPEGELDLGGAAKLAEHLVATGTETVLVNGTTGESPTLHDEEPWELLAAVRDAVGDRATVMIGTGSNDTAKTVAATRRAAAEGADAALVVTPYYNRPDQRGLLHHFRAAAAAASDLPVVLYDIPGRTGRAIDVATLAELAQVESIVGVKDATTDLGKASDVAAATQDAPGGFVRWSGSDEVNLPLLATGAVGVISVAAHLVGPEIAEMVAVFATDPGRARALQLACQPVHRALFAEPSPAPLKGALAARGLPAGPVRPPLADASPGAVTAVLDALAKVEAQR
ncbi:MAG: 4-hydroxy-tetrahydrodipicolinate synthase [Actinomycetota bacterium]